MAQPWDPLPKETAKAYAAFCAYRDLGGTLRSHARVISEGKGSNKEVGQWSSRHNWVSRARAWDAYADQRNREAAIERRIAANRDIAQVAEAFRTMFTMPVRAMLDRLDQPGGRDAMIAELNELSAPQLLSLAAVSAKVLPQIIEIEQRALGVLAEGSTVIVPASTGDDLSTPTEQDRLLRVAETMHKYGIIEAAQLSKTNGK